ncbi:hypothetical protein D3C85_1812850 [compost metagenome]
MTRILRTTQKLINGEWKQYNFIDLKREDCFRLFDNIAPVTDESGNSIFVATSNPYLGDDNHWRIDYETC